MKKIKLSNGATIFGYIIFSVLGYLSFNNAYLPLLIISILEIIKQIRNHNFITAYTFWQLGFFFNYMFGWNPTKRGNNKRHICIYISKNSYFILC